MKTVHFEKMIVVGLFACTGIGAGCLGQSTQDVQISSLAVGSGSAAMIDGSTQAAVASTGTTAPSGVTSFKLCLDRIKLVGTDGNPVKKHGETADDGSKDPDDIRFAPGLIDVSSGQAINWGKANIPVGFTLAEVRVKVHQNKTLCGVDYSIDFNGMTTSEDVEFKFKLNPPVNLDNNTQQLNVSISEVETALEQAAASGGIASIKDTVENTEGSGHE